LVITKNEERAILECLNSLQEFHQILVVDSGSTDGTCQIVRSAGVEVIQFKWNGKYPKKKQWAMELPEIQNDWILLLDADERLSDELLKEIKNFFIEGKNGIYSAGEAPLSYYFNSKKLLYGHKVKKIILMKKSLSKFPVIDDLNVSNMWEVEGHYQPQISGSIYRFKNSIIHDDPDRLFDYFSRHNRYSDWEAFLRLNPEIARKVSETKSIQGKIFSKVQFKPLFFFLYSYFFRFGWLDGRQGFDYAIALSFYYWQIGLKSREKS
jgi:glycosyltransferase involved in cell wall biosynthesis